MKKYWVKKGREIVEIDETTFQEWVMTGKIKPLTPVASEITCWKFVLFKDLSKYEECPPVPEDVIEPENQEKLSRISQAKKGKTGLFVKVVIPLLLTIGILSGFGFGLFWKGSCGKRSETQTQGYPMVQKPIKPVLPQISVRDTVIKLETYLLAEMTFISSLGTSMSTALDIYIMALTRPDYRSIYKELYYTCTEEQNKYASAFSVCDRRIRALAGFIPAEDAKILLGIHKEAMGVIAYGLDFLEHIRLSSKELAGYDLSLEERKSVERITVTRSVHVDTFHIRINRLRNSFHSASVLSEKYGEMSPSEAELYGKIVSAEIKNEMEGRGLIR